MTIQDDLILLNIPIRALKILNPIQVIKISLFYFHLSLFTKFLISILTLRKDIDYLRFKILLFLSIKR